MDEFEKARNEEREAKAQLHWRDIDRCVAFIEGALNVQISQGHNAETGEWHLAFPSSTNDEGWFEDRLDFGDAASCIAFLQGVSLIIATARLQQREPHDENY